MTDISESGRIGAIESRVAILEAQTTFSTGRLDRAEGKLDTFSERITRLEERIAHLPTKEQVIKIALGMLAAITAIIALQGKIQTLLGL